MYNMRQTTKVFFPPLLDGLPNEENLRRCMIWPSKRKEQHQPIKQGNGHVSKHEHRPCLKSPLPLSSPSLSSLPSTARSSSSAISTEIFSPAFAPPFGTVAVNVWPSASASKWYPSLISFGATTSTTVMMNGFFSATF